MTATLEAPTLRRFLRTVRVTLGTALAEHELMQRRAVVQGVTSFRALAAKSRDAWTFPVDGVISRDGLVLAAVERAPGGAPLRLLLQALGAVGLDAFAGREVALSLPAGTVRGSFDRDGRLGVELLGLGVTDEDLAIFELRSEDAPS